MSRPLAAIVCAAFLGQAAAAERLPVRVFTGAEGLSSSTIHALDQDRRGFLWIGTYDGLTRFDGRNFVRFGKADGLPSDIVLAVRATRDGALWVSARGGLMRALAPEPGRNSFQPVPLPGLATTPDVAGMVEDESGRLWVSTGLGVFVVETVGPAPVARRVDVGLVGGGGPLALDRQGDLWIVDGNGSLVRRLRDGRERRYPGGEVSLSGERVSGLAGVVVDPEDRVWVGHAGGTFVFVPQPADRLDREDPRPLAERATTLRVGAPRTALPSRPGEVAFLAGGKTIFGTLVRSVTLGRDGTVWIGAPPALREFGPQELRDYGPANGIRAGDLRAVLEDRSGDLWLGGEGALLRVARGGFSQYDASDGLAHERIGGIFTSRSGELVVLADACHLYRFDGRRFVEFTPPEIAKVPVPGWGWGQYFVEDRHGGWWMPTGTGLFEFAPVAGLDDLRRARSRRRLRDGAGLPGKDVFRVYEDRSGAIWVSVFGVEPLVVRAPGGERFEVVPGWRELTNSATASRFVEDRAGNLWVGLYPGGVARRRAGRWQLFQPADGVAPGFVRDLLVDRRGRLWIATSGGGLARTDEPDAERPGFVSFGREQGLSSDIATCLAEDGAGRLFVGTPHGVERLDPERGAVRVFTVDDGLPDDTAWVCHADPDGTFWFGTAHQLVRFRPDAERRPAPPQVFLAGVRAGGVAQALGPETAVLEIPADRRAVDIEFLGVALGIGPRLRFQYRMAGLDEGWSHPQREQSVHYARLPPGRYRFQVRALTTDGLESPRPAELGLRVLAPWWQRPWVVGLAAAALAAGVWMAYRLRVRRLLAVERVRTRIAADLHDDVGASLSRIGLLSELARAHLRPESDAAAMLGQIGEESRALVENTSDIVWAVDPRRDDLESLIVRLRRFAGDLLEARGIELEFAAPDDASAVALEPEKRRELYLVLKEAIHNVAKHSGARAAAVRIEVREGAVWAEVRDDGVGIEASEMSAAEAAGRQGLPSMRGRARSLQGEVRVDTAPGQGTRIQVRVPLNR